jgi:phosphoglycolate phosphatase
MQKTMTSASQAARLIVFDWDGTLMDSETQIVHAIQSAIADLGLETRAPDQCRNIIGLGLQEAVDALYPGRGDAFRERFVACYRRHWFSDSHASDLFPGTRETLQLLMESGFRLGVATGKSRTGLDKALRQTGLTDLFSATRCADETRSKPHPRMLNEILEEVGVPGRQTLMVGDTEYDMQMANHAGVAPVAVSYGVHARERLLAHRPLVCLDCITELVDWLVEKSLLNTDGPAQKSLAVGD